MTTNNNNIVTQQQQSSQSLSSSSSSFTSSLSSPSPPQAYSEHNFNLNNFLHCSNVYPPQQLIQQQQQQQQQQSIKSSKIGDESMSSPQTASNLNNWFLNALSKYSNVSQLTSQPAILQDTNGNSFCYWKFKICVVWFGFIHLPEVTPYMVHDSLYPSCIEGSLKKFWGLKMMFECPRRPFLNFYLRFLGYLVSVLKCLYLSQ